jgi:hypothetical protein
VKAGSGVIVSADVETSGAAEALPFPVVVIVACAAVRTALLEAALDALLLELEPEVVTASDTTLLIGATALLATANVGLAAEAVALESDCETTGVDATEVVAIASWEPPVTEPALIWLVSEPLACPPEVLTQNCLSTAGRCQYCGATSITT